MNTYLIIITTVLVLTQVIRIVQNTVSLFRQEHKIEKNIGWIKDNDISKEDFELQREAYRLIVENLKEEKQ